MVQFRDLLGAGTAIGTKLLTEYNKNSVGPLTTTIGKLRSFEWGSTHLWNFKFIPNSSDGAKFPKQFNTWFPAIDMEDTLYSISNGSIDGPLTDYKYPLRSGALDLSLTFADTAEYKLKDWFEYWTSTIVRTGDLNASVATLEEASRTIMYQMLDPKKKSIQERKYKVIPSGELKFSGTSNNDITIYNIQFDIVGSSAVTLHKPSDKKTKFNLFGYNPLF